MTFDIGVTPDLSCGVSIHVGHMLDMLLPAHMLDAVDTDIQH